MNEVEIELLYFWIDKTEYACFEHTGFNLSADYSFNYDCESHVLTCEKENNLNVFDNGKTLKTITAIVGNNGVGKTTLLNCIINRKFSYDFSKTGHDKNRSKFFITVFKKGNDLIVDNFTDNDIWFEQCTGERKEALGILHAKRYPPVFDNVTTAYLSTESKTKTDLGIESSGRSTVVITPFQLKNGSTAFFKMKALELGDYQFETKYFDLEDFITSAYYANNSNRLIRNKNLTISFKTASDIYITKSISFPFLDNLNSITDGARSGLDKSRLLVFGPTISLLFSLASEIEYSGHTIFKDLWKDEMIVPSLESIQQYIDERIKNKDQKLYFNNALKEINLLNSIITDDYHYEDIPLREAIKSNNIRITQNVYSFKPLINAILKHKKSFIFKYLVFELDKSDGELSHLRHLSYLYYLSNIELFSPKYKLGNNIILLLDEIENHLHPEWQRLLINDFSSTINSLFKGRNVQLILTTHSPLVLSDIPSQNILYLSLDKDGNRRIEKREDVKTFGSNIYNLFNDSFYFNGSVLIGEYAKRYIDSLYREILASSKEDYEQLKNKIMIIGEPILRNKLLNMIGEKSPNTIQRMPEKSLVNELERKIDELQSLLAVLKEETND